MRLRYRVLLDEGDHLDVRVDITDDATVGDVARAVSETLSEVVPGYSAPAPPTLTIVAARAAANRPPPSATALDSAPSSGSTVRLVELGTDAPVPPHRSPVVLLSTTPVAPSNAGLPAHDDSNRGRATRLSYGWTDIGPVRVHVGDDVTVHTTDDPARVEVDGAVVRGGTGIGSGSLLRVGADGFIVKVEGPLRPPLAGPWRQHSSLPAVVEHHEPVVVDLPTPPSADRTPGFPLLSAVVPLLMGAVMWWATRSLMVAGFALFSVAFVVASGIESRREHRRERRFRDRTFAADLADAAERLTVLNEAEILRRRRDLPSGQEVTSWPDVENRRIWERGRSHPDPLTVHLGTADIPPADAARAPAGGREDLARQVRHVAERFESITGPVGADLDGRGLRGHGVGVAGHHEGAASLARSVVAQLAVMLAPERLAIDLYVSPDRSGRWEWLRWLPHEVRRASGAPDPDRGRPTGDDRIRLALVDRSGGNAQHPLVIPHGPCVVVASSAAELPDGLATVVHVDGERSTIRTSDGPPRPIAPDGLDVDACELLARSLAPLRPGADPLGVPDDVSLGDVLADRRLLTCSDRVTAEWECSRSAASGLGAPIGKAAGGVVRVDLSTDGPHGLIAGTTGSGKSELLRTLVLSLALHHPPDRVTFLLVDYKGGAGFRPVESLPHVVGVVSDLRPSGAHRAITSLRAEIRRRENLVADAGVDGLVHLPDAPPALVVVVDEFATLASELPDVLDGLLDVAQRGRSLGIHLLLATQRPSGVVTDAVRANLSMRIALRMIDEDDSRDVIDGPEAATIPLDRVGRAILRNGPTERSPLQVASTGAPTGDGVTARCEPLTAVERAVDSRGDHDNGRVTQLDAAVAACRSAAAGLEPARRPWIEPLPERIRVSALPGPSRPGGVVLGLVDRPQEQRQVAAEVDLTRRGGLLVLGAARSGRTGTLMAFAAGARRNPVAGATSSPVVAYGIDGGRGLTDRHVAAGRRSPLDDVVSFDDAERVLRLLRGLRARCRRGADGTGSPASATVLLLVDSVGALVEHHERINCAEATDLLVTIAVDGPGAGVHLAVTAGRPTEVPPGVLNALDHRLVLRCPSPDEAAALGCGADLADADIPPGRGELDGHPVQVADPSEQPEPPQDEVGGRSDRGERIGRLPQFVPVGDLPAPERWRIPVGLRDDDLTVAVLDLTDQHALVVGPPRSGCTTALDTIVQQVGRGPDGPQVTRIDGRHPDGAVAVLHGLLALPASGQRHLLAVDDLPELLAGPDPAEIEDLLTALVRPTPGGTIRVVAGGEADGITRCYGELVRRLRSGRTGILLRPDPDLHPGLLHASLPRHDELRPAPGRGWIVTPDGASAVQLAR